MLRRPLFVLLAFLLVASTIPAETATPAPMIDRTHVDVDPTRTSIYIGSVSMTMPTFVREGATYTAAYTAKVFPYFFYNEKGTLTVTIADEQLDQLAQGKTIEFTGRAFNTEGQERKVTGKATPADAKSGKLDVHVWVSKRIQLIFHTKYRFR